MMRTIVLATILLVLPSLADDRLRDAQAELKIQGFYFGEVDGKAGTETNAAIRRFQIRNGLKVTGELNEETLTSLGIGVPDAPEPKPAPKAEQENPPHPAARKPAATPEPQPDVPAEPVPPAKPARDLLRRPGPPDADEPAPPPRRAYRNDPAIVPPPTPIPNPVDDDFTTFYHGTPYATAPREVQVEVLRKAQNYLGRRGLYRVVADGLPGPATVEALFAYQDQRRLARTGRLDMATLAELNLLPGRSPDAPPMRPFYDPGRRRDRSIDFNSLRRL